MVMWLAFTGDVNHREVLSRTPEVTVTATAP
jgi:hypothetical protein